MRPKPLTTNNVITMMMEGDRLSYFQGRRRQIWYLTRGLTYINIGVAARLIGKGIVVQDGSQNVYRLSDSWMTKQTKPPVSEIHVDYLKMRGRHTCDIISTIVDNYYKDDVLG